MKNQVSDLYLQQVAIEMLVSQLRDAIDEAVHNGILTSSILGALRLIEREVEDRAIAELDDSEVEKLKAENAKLKEKIAGFTGAS